MFEDHINLPIWLYEISAHGYIGSCYHYFGTIETVPDPPHHTRPHEQPTNPSRGLDRLTVTAVWLQITVHLHDRMCPLWVFNTLDFSIDSFPVLLSILDVVGLISN